MRITRTIPLLTLFAAAGVLATLAPAASRPASHAALVIRHQTVGCHSWSLNEGPSRVQQTVAIRRGGSVTVTNDDLMPHQLIETGGPPVTYTRLTLGGMTSRGGTYPPSMLARIGASSRITFARAGVYRFTTKAGEDLMANVKTVGPDNHLRLTVVVP